MAVSVASGGVRGKAGVSSALRWQRRSPWLLGRRAVAGALGLDGHWLLADHVGELAQSLLDALAGRAGDQQRRLLGGALQPVLLLLQLVRIDRVDLVQRDDLDLVGQVAAIGLKFVPHRLEAYGGDLTDKVEIVALNKIDAVDPDELKKQKDRLKRAAKKTPLLISGATGEGVKEALRKLADVISEQPVSIKAKSTSDSAATEEPWAAPLPPQG